MFGADAWGVGVDVIVLQNTKTREWISTEFLVRFEFTLGKGLLCSSLGVNRTADWKVTSLSYSKSSRPSADEVMGGEYTLTHTFNRIGPIEVYVNDVHCPNVHVIVQDFEESTVHFQEPGGAYSTSPSHHILKEMNLRKGLNRVRFHAKELDCNANFNLFNWDLNTPVIVCDIDGTLTRSDVRGYVETVYFNTYSYVHQGAVKLVKSLESDLNCNVMYLTTRPIEHQHETKSFLDGLEQDGTTLPRGPLFTNKKFIGNVIYDEIFVKNISSFKSQALHSIASIYQLAGFSINKSPFLIGFGNRVTDARAYQSAGIDPACIFILNPSSQVSLWSCDASRSQEMGDMDSKMENVPKTQKATYTGYDDSNLKEYINHILNQEVHDIDINSA